MSPLIILSLALQLMFNSKPNAVLYKEETSSIQQQGQGVLYLDKLPPFEYYASAGKGSSTVEDYDDSKEAREERSKKTYDAYLEVVGVKKVKITQKEPVIIKGLNATKKYLLKVYADDGKTAITSFHFSFKSKGSNKLRLSFNPFYSSWRLDVMKK